MKAFCDDSNVLNVLFFFLYSCTGGLGVSGSADGACLADDVECAELHDRLGMEAIRTLHQQLDDDDNGNIDLTESDDVSCIRKNCLFRSENSV